MVTTAYAKQFDQYEKKKNKLIAELQTLTQDRHNKIRLQKNTSNLFRERQSNAKKMDVRDFNQVIFIDKETHIAEVEGMTTYADIVHATLKQGFLPTVVPELKSITIGGALAGCGIESSSFRYGLTHETMKEYDLLLADGNVITCNAMQNKNLYYAFPNTYGTLGYALKISVQLIPIKKYIKLTHLHFNNAQQYFEELKKRCYENHHHGSIAYIDGVIFDENDMYITLGEFVDKAPYTSNYKYMQIYYQSIKKRREDYLTTLDYIWRWDTDWFWCSRHFYMQNFFVRLLLGKWMLHSATYWKIRHFFNTHKIANKLANLLTGPVESIIQDVEIPIQNAKEFLDFFQKEIKIKPIWICPTISSQKQHQYDFYKMEPDLLYINFGFWDMRHSQQKDGFYNKKIESKVLELGGHKSLYSRIYYSEEEFWKIFDKSLYLDLKKQYDPQGRFGDLYSKCKGKA